MSTTEEDGATTPAETTNAHPQVWARRVPINYPKTIEISGGTASALLAGFSLSTVAQLLLGQTPARWGDEAVATFAIAAALFVYALQFTAVALGFNATPSERVAYNPEARDDPSIRRVVRLRQWEETSLRDRYQSRARMAYNLGMLAFLAGLGLLVVPSHWHPWHWGRFIAFVVVAAAFVLELLWWLRPSVIAWLVPQQADVQRLVAAPTDEPDQVEDDGAKYFE